MGPVISNALTATATMAGLGMVASSRAARMGMECCTLTRRTMHVTDMGFVTPLVGPAPAKHPSTARNATSLSALAVVWVVEAVTPTPGNASVLRATGGPRVSLSRAQTTAVVGGSATDTVGSACVEMDSLAPGAASLPVAQQKWEKALQ